ncbi:MAG: UDP-N-acetylmuramoyl-L-alanyl-D-glutamate--2,6-diaminopimelate ligase, partial [Hyphomicrobiales bacterium]|nr:UDP-N-acetylmuramoyl-L-alanyl-D-glutamate--2,6-diaminopimelate ligase [Hyphomicrobiales bacterium]
MTLADLIDAPMAAELAARPAGDPCADSRLVRPGDVFFALPGAKDDGLRHVADAAARGAVAVVSSRDPGAAAGAAAWIPVADPRRALAVAARRAHPRQPATLVAITGTSGKTSVAAFLRQIWERLGVSAASIGTTGIVSRAFSREGSLTTPDPVALHRDLDALARAGVTHSALEASSHGLDQKRLDGADFAAGGFTNLSRDHLDYHPD